MRNDQHVILLQQRNQNGTKRQASGIGHANMGSRKDTLNSLVDLNLKWIAGTGDLHEP